MKSIITKRLGLTAGLTGALFAAGSLQAQTFEPGIDFTADVVSNYVFRGDDVHKAKFEQDKKSLSSFNLAPAFQPSLTFKFADGWSLNIWGSFAMVGRNDVDSDELYQAGPGGYDGGYLNGLVGQNLDMTTVFNNIVADPDGSGPSTDALSWASVAGQSTTGPGFHKEANGLKRVDEVDVTLSYSTSSKLGTMTGGIVSYNYVNTVQQSATYIEMFAGFSPAALPEFSLSTYVETAFPGQAGSTYTGLTYSKSLEIGKEMSLSIAPTVGYATDTSRKIVGWKNANLPLTLAMGGFHVGVTGVYRMDTRFFDSDTTKGDGTAYFGGSSINDGMVVDPGKTYGIGNAISNALIQAEINKGLPASYTYEFKQRQHLPKLVYFYTVGYTMSF